MAHLVNPDREYRLLQNRLDATVTGAPDSPVLMEILRLLFKPDEADLARRVPGTPTPLTTLARKLGRSAGELGKQLGDLAERGLMFDFELDSVRYFALPPVVIGFFEFVFMRARDGLPMAELARLFEKYMTENREFVASVFQGQTQLGRALVREETLPTADHAEVLDHERASEILERASSIAVGLCPCRHKRRHLGTACNAPEEVCLSFGYAADTMARSSSTKLISREQAREILQRCKEHHLVQVGDNVQRRVTFICNCCRCCCGMLDAINRFGIRNAVVTSNWLVALDESACVGCGKCVPLCPVEALEMVPAPGKRPPSQCAVREPELCLGCGVCATVCRKGALRMVKRPRRVLYPETMLEKTVAMAIERGKLAGLLFDQPERLSHRVLGGIVRGLERSTPAKALLAIRPLRSAFLQMIAAGARWQLGPLAPVMAPAKPE
ncbi:MAG: 4Fe-4S binding protein [Candidatus Riflebacteria bacterium]|nr:4Fe-4S binding protein [Candidatus Riflebacteria bacterium]